MPELPEVECVRRSIAPVVMNRRVIRAELFRDDFLTVDDPARPAVAAAVAMLEGCVIAELRRHGKQLAFIGKGRSKRVQALVVHLGMSGQVLHIKDENAMQGLTHVHAVWELGPAPGKKAGGYTLVAFRDPRRFGGLWAYSSLETLTRKWGDLGPDALTIDAPGLAAGLAGSKRSIKAALLDQSVLAGVGNIYADEALFQAKIHPLRVCDHVKPQDVKVLAKAIREVLERSIQSGGSTLRDYRNAAGEPGSYQTKRAVYGRAGEACIRCGKPLASETIAQRTTTWCPQCQAE